MSDCLARLEGRHLRFPLDEPDVLRELHAGERLWVDGQVIGLRDATHIAIFDRGERPATDLRGAAVLHTAPNVRVLPDGRYEKVCIGTTTSARMSRFTRPLMSDYGVRAIMGKAGLAPDALPVLAEFGGVTWPSSAAQRHSRRPRSRPSRGSSSSSTCPSACGAFGSGTSGPCS